MKILAVSGDVGGGRAVMAVLEELERRGVPFEVVDHGHLRCVPGHWPRRSEEHGGGDLRQEGVTALLFSTSVADRFALEMAVMARRRGVPCVCLLDNWMSYRERLELAPGEYFYPDHYLVMDELAAEAARGNGVPAPSITVSGQPSLAGLRAAWQQCDMRRRDERLRQWGFDPDKKLLVFVSEPAEADQGGPLSVSYRGYTEKTVLQSLCAHLQPWAQAYQLAVLPHPREDRQVLEQVWQDSCGGLSGGILDLPHGREAILWCDGAVGMVSILLYEAWLLARPVISWQPGLIRPELDIWRSRAGVHRVNAPREMAPQIRVWLEEVSRARGASSVRPELTRHVQAGALIADMLVQISRGSGT